MRDDLAVGSGDSVGKLWGEPKIALLSLSLFKMFILCRIEQNCSFMEGVSMAILSVVAGITVKNFPQALAWYERVFGPPGDAQPMQGDAEWRLCEGGGLQLYHQEYQASPSFVVIVVSNLTHQLSHLEKQGIVAGPVQKIPAGKIAIVTDPEGNQITFVQPATA